MWGFMVGRVMVGDGVLGGGIGGVIDDRGLGWVGLWVGGAVRDGMYHGWVECWVGGVTVWVTRSWSDGIQWCSGCWGYS